MADDTLGNVPGQRPARVTLHLKNGAMHTAIAEVRKGDPERPMTAVEKQQKCIGLMTPVWGDSRAKTAMVTIATLPEAANMQHWSEQLRSLINA